MRLNVYGHCSDDSGWAQHCRYFVASLNATDGPQIEIALTAWDSDDRNAAFDNADIAIGIGPVSRMPEIQAKYRIGFMVWETTRLPGDMRRALAGLDEIWVPSRWGKTLLVDNGLSAERIQVLPLGVDPDIFRPDEPDQAQSATRPFRFLCVGKWEVRKGIADLARAYCCEFAPDEPVELVLHCFNPYLPGFSIAAAIQSMGLAEHAPIRASEPASRAAMVALYNCCDVFVLPTKAEGWGLPILEAMACARPAIATNYGAHTEFLDNSVGRLIAVDRMIPVDDPFFYNFDEPLGDWAQPDIAHLRHLMREATSLRESYRQLGLRARHAVLARWTWRHAAEAARQRLWQICA